MINTYFGQFDNYDELKAHCKEVAISQYRKLAKQFSNNPTLELSSMMSDLALKLVKSYGLTWDDIEDLEIA